MPAQTDVLVIGGGATGTGIARDLALRGLEVTLVERGGLSSGTSGRSHGLCHSGARYAEADREGATECIAERQILDDIAGECVQDTGGLFVQVAEDDPAYFEAKLEACAEIGIETEVLDGDEARELVPRLSPAIERAMVVPDGVIYPSWLIAANAVDAENNGATIHTHTPVTGIETGDAHIHAVELGGEVNDWIEPEYVVNATGAWADQLAAMAGITLEMHPNRGVMVSIPYDGLPMVLNRCRIPDDGDIIVPHKDEVVLGTTSVDIDDPDEYPTAEWELERTFEECAQMLPDVVNASQRRTWWGVRPLYGPDEASRDGRGISRDFFLLDHDTDGVGNFATIVGGKLTTYRSMAEATADLVCERLEVDADCVTAEQQLPGVTDPVRLNEFAARYDSRGPTDEDVLAGVANRK